MNATGGTKAAGRDASAGTAAARTPAGDLARGTNQIGVRLYNERLVLSLIRRHESLPKAEIARLTGLSPQTITVIMRALEADGLVVKRGRQRGKVGQPSVPFALNPDGAMSLGIKVGRRSADIILMDFTGTVRATLARGLPVPEPRTSSSTSSPKALRGSPRRVPEGDRIAGVGHRHPVRIVELGGGSRRPA